MALVQQKKRRSEAMMKLSIHNSMAHLRAEKLRRAFQKHHKRILAGAMHPRPQLHTHSSKPRTDTDAKFENSSPPPQIQQQRFHGFFQRQVQARCGMHALNNALGFDFLNEADLNDACDVYLNEAAFEGNPERRASHIAPGGWYSEAVLATVLRIKQNLFKLDLDNPVRSTNESARRLFNPHVAGIVINHPLAHWVAIREESDAIWLLDSLYTPRQLTFKEYQAYLTRYPNSFAVMIL